MVSTGVTVGYTSAKNLLHATVLWHKGMSTFMVLDVCITCRRMHMKEPHNPHLSQLRRTSVVMSELCADIVSKSASLCPQTSGPDPILLAQPNNPVADLRAWAGWFKSVFEEK